MRPSQASSSKVGLRGWLFFGDFAIADAAQEFEAKVVGNATKPRPSAFEVVFNGNTVYSKLAAGKFPDPKEVVASLRAAGLK